MSRAVATITPAAYRIGCAASASVRKAPALTTPDPELAITVAAGALLGLTQLLHDQPERDSAQAADRVTDDLLRMYSLP